MPHIASPMDPSSNHRTAPPAHLDDEGERRKTDHLLQRTYHRTIALWQQFSSPHRLTVGPLYGYAPSAQQGSSALTRPDPFTVGSWRLDRRHVKRFVRFLHHRFKASSYCLHLHFASTHQMEQLNQQHRDVPASTDVLSFPQLPTHPEALFSPTPGQTKARWQHGHHLGDMVICLAKVIAYATAGHYEHHLKAAASNQAAARLEQALLLTITHGYLHLLGYDHIKANHRAHMEAEERSCLKQWSQQRWRPLIRPTTHVSTPMLRGHHGIS